jgi:hypothetical protein
VLADVIWIKAVVGRALKMAMEFDARPAFKVTEPVGSPSAFSAICERAGEALARPLAH